jgi:hypothetical protein
VRVHGPTSKTICTPPQGNLEWEQLGFGADMKWQEMIIAKLDEVLKQSHQESGH